MIEEKQIKNFHSLIENSSFITTVLKSDGTIEYNNVAFYNTFCYEETRIIGKNVFDFIHPKDRAKIKKLFHDFLANKEVYLQVEFRFRESDGLYLAIETIFKDCIHDEKIKGIVVSSVVVAERKVQYKAIEKDKRGLNMILQTSPFSVIVSTIEGAKILFANRKAGELFKIPHADFPGKHVTSFYVNPGDRTKLMEKIKKYEYYDDQEIELKNIEGNRFLATMSGRAIYFKTERCVLVSINNISAAKHTETLLNKAEANYNALVENSESAIWTIDRDYRITSMNSEFENRLHEKHHSQLKLGENILETFPPAVQKMWKDLYDKAFKGNSFSIEQNYVFENQTTDRQVSFNPIIFDGDIIGVSVFSKDISSKKRLFADLELSNKNMKEILKLAPYPIVINSIEGSRIKYINEQASALFKLDQETIKDFKVTDFYVYPKDRERLIEEVKRKGFVKDFEVQIKDKKDNIFWGLVSTQMIEYDNQNCLISAVQNINERKIIQQKLVKNEQMLQAIYNKSFDALFLINTGDDTILDCNEKALKLFEIRNKEEIIGSIGDDMKKIPFTRMERNEMIAELKINGVSTREIEFTTKKGKNFWGMFVITTIDTGDSQFNLVRVTDISQRKKIEEDIRKSEERFRKLIQNSTDIISLIEMDGTFRYQSPSFYKYFEYKESDVIGKNAFSFIHPDDIHGAQQRILSLITEGPSSAPVEFRYRKPDGSYLYMEAIGNNCLDDPNIAGIVINTRDVTERTLMMETIKSHNQYLENTLKVAPFPLVITNLDNNEVVFANKRAYELFKITGGEGSMTQMTLDYHVHKEDEQAINELVNQKGSITDFETELKDKEGKKFWALISGQVVSYKNKVCFIEAINNIDQMKQTEITIKEKNAELEKTNSELDRFVYSASHDLRAPLTSVLGLIELSESEENRTLSTAYLQMMKKSLKKLDSFILDIVSYSRNKRLDVEVEKIEFDQLVKETLEHYKFIKGADKIEIKTRIAAAIPFYSDRRRINVLLNNLVSNVIKYHNYNQPNPYMEFDIKIFKNKAIINIVDNGQGIKVEHQKKIFEMFYVVSKENNNVGSGLGLYIVKETIRKLNGTIKLKSKPNVGSVFKMELPNLN